MLITIGLTLLFIIVLAFIFQPSKLKEPQLIFPKKWKEYLEKTVHFYRNLRENQRNEFEYRVHKFILNKKIEGVSCEILYEIPLLVAASAIIPMFNFPEYYYPKLKEILIYPNGFDSSFQTAIPNKEILGLVGAEGILNQTMILSKSALLEGFRNTKDGKNVGIHEFVHLIDHSDKVIDGLPKILMTHDYSIPFLEIIEKEINDIQRSKSEINPYGAANKAEFFAVSCEYFFENPDKMKQRHPELHRILMELFRMN